MDEKNKGKEYFMTIHEALLKRGHSKCELCSSNLDLTTFEVSPVKNPPLESSVLVCKTCRHQIDNPETMEANHWHCLHDSMWCEFPAVQVLAWRVLQKLTEHGWAQDLLEQLYLEEETLKWAEEGVLEEKEEEVPTLDNFGNILVDGDKVSLIKNLDVKGANFVAKRGTIVKKIVLTGDPELIEGRINGSQIVLKTCFLKKIQ
jgi:protein PhnA